MNDMVLGKDEKLKKKSVFTHNLLFAWLKISFSLTSKRVVGQQPNTLLGVIPLGKSEVTYPLKNISSVGVSNQFYLKRFIIGLILCLIALSSFGDSFLNGLIFLFIGSIPLLNSFTTKIAITNNAGESSIIEMSIVDKQNAQEFVNEVNTSVVEVA